MASNSNLVRWDPWQELANFRQAMDRLVDDAFGGVAGRLPGQTPAIALDIMETPDHYIVKAAVPGFGQDDVEIMVENDVLTLRGQRREEQKDERSDYLRREIHWGNFERSLRLPPTVDAENAHAEFENGILTLSLPKKPEAKPKAIKITPRQMIEA